MNVNRTRLVDAASEPGPRRVLSMLVPAAIIGALVLAGAAPGAMASVNQEPQIISFWGMGGDGNDPRGGNHLTLEGVEGVDYFWAEDRFGFPAESLGLAETGQAYAHTAGATVATDASVTIDLWVGLVSLTDRPQTLLSQTGRIRPALQVQVTPAGSWRFTIPTGDPRSGLGVVETEPGSVKLGVWNHVAGVLDLSAGEILLYVNGELAAAGDAGPAPQTAEGPLYFGATGAVDGTTSQHLHGFVDSVRLWSSALDPLRIRDLGIGGGRGDIPGS